LTDLKPTVDTVQENVAQEVESVDRYTLALERLTKKTLKILRFLCDSGCPTTVLTAGVSQPDLAKKLHVTRQALSVHISRLAEAGFIRVGRGFINVTEEGLKASGYHHSPVILIVRVAPQNHRDAYDRIKRIHASEIFRVAGDADFALLLEHRDLDKVLQDLYAIPGVLDTKSLIATETLRQTLQ
jgi:DNA-binding MarR family transcriptional regulator